MKRLTTVILFLSAWLTLWSQATKVVWEPVMSLDDLTIGDSVVFTQADGNGGEHEYAINQQSSTSTFLLDVNHNLCATKDVDGNISPSGHSRFCVYKLTATNGAVHQIQFSYYSLFKRATRYLSIAPSTTTGSSYSPTYAGTAGISQGDYPQDLYLEQLDDQGHFYAYKQSGSSKYYAGYTDYFTVMHVGRYTSAYNQHAQKLNLSDYTTQTKMACAWNMYKRHLYYQCHIHFEVGDKATCAITDTTCYSLSALPNVDMVDLNYNIIGWFDGKDTLLVGSALYPTADMTLTAVYEPAQTHFDLGEHCVWMDNADTIQTLWGRTITLPQAKGKQGYHFLGWATTPNQTSESAIDIGRAEDSYTISTNSTFYAVYQKAESVSEFWIADKENPLQNGDEIRLVMDHGQYQNECFVLRASTTKSKEGGTLSLERVYPSQISNLSNAYSFKTANPNGGVFTDYYGNFVYNNYSASCPPILYTSAVTNRDYQQGYKITAVDDKGHYTVLNTKDQTCQYLCYMDASIVHIGGASYTFVNQHNTQLTLPDARQQGKYPNVWSIYRKTLLYKYHVTLLPGAGGGEPVVLEGYQVTLPTNVPSFSLPGDYLDIVAWVHDGDTIAAGTTIHPIEDMTFEAVYGAPKLSFDVGLHSSDQFIDKEITQMALPNVHAEDGWRFLGWSETEGATTPDFEATELYPRDGNLKQNTTLYAVYEQKEWSYLFKEVFDVDSIHAGDEIVLVMADGNKGGTTQLVVFTKPTGGAIQYANWNPENPDPNWIFKLTGGYSKNNYAFANYQNGKGYSFHLDTYNRWAFAREESTIMKIEPDGFDHFRLNASGWYICYSETYSDRVVLLQDGYAVRYAISQYDQELSLHDACQVQYSKPAAWRIFIATKLYKAKVSCYSHGPRVVLTGPYAVLPSASEVVADDGYQFLFWRDENGHEYQGGDTMHVEKDMRVDAVYLAPGEDLPVPDPIPPVPGDGLDGLGFDMFGQCALNGDTAYKYIRTGIDVPVDIPLEFAYGWKDGFIPEYIQVVDSPVIGKVVIDSASQSVQFTPYKGYIGVDGFLIRMLDHQHVEQLLYIDVESCNEYMEDGYEYIFTMLRGASAYEAGSASGSSYYCRSLANVPTRVELITYAGDTIVRDIKPKEYFEIDLTASAAHSNQANYIRSSAPIVVETVSYEPYSSDGNYQLPLCDLDTSYILQAAQWSEVLPDLFAVVATVDNTIVTITPACPLSGHKAYETYTVELQKGQVYRCQSAAPGYGYSLSGSYVHANHPIAVYQGNVCSMLIPPVGGNAGAMDHMEEQTHPLSHAAGTEFVVVGTVARTEDYVEFVALENNTTVNIAGAIHHCNAFDTVWSIVKVNEALYVTSDKPIVGQYFVCGGDFGDAKLGDPDQFYIHPTSDFATMTAFSCHRTTYVYGSACSNIKAIGIAATATAVQNGIYFDGELLTGFKKVMNCHGQYYYKQYIIPDRKTGGVHTLLSKEGGFAAYTYGMFSAESYSFATPLMHSHKKVFREMTYDTICHGQSYEWQGRTLTQKGAYTDTVREELLIREVHNLYLHVEDSAFLDTTMLVCLEELPIMWRGHELLGDTILQDIAPNDHGCDSVYQLTLQSHRCNCEAHSYTDTIVEWETLPFIWFGKEYNDYGFYRDTMIGAGSNKCDSIGELYLRYHRLYKDSVNVCNDAEVSFDTPFGTYQVGKCNNFDGCILMTDDSVCLIELQLTINRHDETTILPIETIYILAGDAYVWFDEPYTETGLYTFRKEDLLYGCDTVYQLQLMVMEPHIDEQTVHACADQPYEWHGRLLTSSGTYVDSLTAVHGEDSICILHLVLHESYLDNPYDDGSVPSEPAPLLDDDDPAPWYNPGQVVSPIPADTICGNSYVWFGNVLTENGVYYDTVPSIWGCDSLVWINLVLMNCCDSTPMVTDTVIAYGDSITWFGHTYSQSGIYADTIFQTDTCDIYGQLILHVLYSDTILACNEDPVSFVTPFGTWDSGDCDTLMGCLKMATDGTCLVEGALFVQRLKADSIAQDTTVCQGTVVSWHGFTILDEGIYYDTIRYTTEGACDSLYCRLTIHHTSPIETDTTDYICFGADYEWHGQMVIDVTEDLTLIDVLSTVDGCDSVVTLTLHVSPQPITRMEQQTICEGTSYTWHTYRDSVVSAPGLYEDTLWTEQGCIKETYTLILSHKFPSTGDTTAYVCYGDLPYLWYGKTLTEACDTSWTTTNAAGCDSIVTLHLFVSPQPITEHHDSTICHGDMIDWHGQTIHTAGIYYDTARVTMGNGMLCDSIWYELSVSIQKSDTTKNNISICAGNSYTWQRNGKPDRIISEAGEYWDTVRYVQTGCDSMIYYLNLQVDDITRDSTSATTCAGTPYLWRGRSLEVADVYRDTAKAQTATECDTIYTLLLIINQPTTGDTTAYVCEGEIFEWHGSEAHDGDTIKRTNAAGCDSIVTLHLITVPLPSLTIAADTMINKGDTAALWAMGADYYAWEPTAFVSKENAQYTGAFPTSSTTFTVTGYNEAGKNMLVNGDFELGNVGFNTTYKYYAPRTTNKFEYGKYTIGQWASDLWPTYQTATRPDFPGYNNSWFMVVDGSESPNAMLWEQTVEVKPNNDYALSCLLVSLLASHKNGNYALLQFYINGQPIGEIFHSPSVLHEWTQFYEVWNSGTATSATIQIINQNTDAAGNDFGLDNLSFVPLMHDCATTEQVTVLVAKPETEEHSICSDELPYSWHGRDLTVPGTYTDTILSASGFKDSIVTLLLTIYESGTDEETITICDKQLPYTWKDKTCTAAGDYTFDTLTVHGCDSTITLHLIVNDHSEQDTTAYVCYEDMPFIWHNKEAQDGDTIKLTNSAGCDSIVTLHLFVSPQPKTEHQDSTICHGDMIDWHNQTINTDGIYYDTARVTMGNGMLCDSIWYELSVSIQKSDTTKNNISICAGNSYTWQRNGKPDRIISEAGEYWDTVRYVQTGCDSMIYYLNLQVDDITRDSTSATTCAGTPYLWRGNSLEVADVYRDTAKAQTATECDTIYTLLLIINQPTTGDTTATACDSFTWHGATYTESTNEPQWTTTNAAGCDSIVTLKLTIYKSGTGEETKTICDKQLPYTWKDKTCTAAGDYTFDTLTVHGCDSTITLHLIVLNCCPDTTMQRMELSICDTLMPYTWTTWRTNIIDKVGPYADTLRNESGCDSIIYTLNLDTFHCCAPLKAAIDVPDYICADAPSLPIDVKLISGECVSYSLHFTNPTRNKMPFRDTTIMIDTQYASEDTWTLDIPVPNDPNDSTHYVRPDDNYKVSLTLNDGCGNSVSFGDSIFSVYYPSWIMDQHWDDVIALLNDRYNGGYTFSNVEWLRDGDKLLGESNYYIYLPHELWTNPYHQHQSYFYQALLTRTDDGKTLPTCPLEPWHIDNTNVLTDPYVSVTPTLVPIENPVVHVMTNTEGTYWVYDPTGKLLQTADYEPCEHNVFDIQLRYHVQTMYILVFTPRNEKNPLQKKYSVVKVLVE